MRHFVIFGATAFALALSGCGGPAVERADSSSVVPLTTTSLGVRMRGVPPARFQPVAHQPVAYKQAAAPSWILPAALPSKLVYVSSALGNVVNIYNTGGTMLGQITGSILNKPDGMAVDSKGNLYVTNYGAGTVLVFAKGSTTPKLTLSHAGTSPVDVVVSNTGTVFVSNGKGPIGPGFIDVYKPGTTKPSRILQDTASNPFGLGVSLDSSGNLYWSLSTNGGGGPGKVDAFAHAKGPAIGTNITVGSPGGLAFDSLGNLVLCDVNAPAVDVFPPGSPTPSRQFARVGEPLFHAFNPSESEDYVTDFLSLNVGVYDYGTGVLKRTITQGLSSSVPPQGVAVDPRAKY